MRADARGASSLFDKEITGFSIDSRSVAAGELFYALSPTDYARHGFNGTDFADAHDFIAQALASGAVAAVARRERVQADRELQRFGNQLLLVEDVIGALQLLAQEVFLKWNQPLVAITGSAGKTTTKDLTAHVLTQAGRRVLKSKKNFNNELGLPLSILQMETAGARPSDYDLAVLEMGMSTQFEIKRLCEIAAPDIGVELLVAPVHLEFMGTIENIAAAKAQLVEGLKPDGTAILNADDQLVAAMRSKHKGRTLTFGIEHEADVMARDIETARLGLTRFRLQTPHGEASAELPMPGRHNLMNALAAATVATCFAMSAQETADALSSAEPSEMRGEVITFAEGFTLIDDSYNSNPRSLLSMVRSLVEGSHSRQRSDEQSDARRRTVVVAGEMLELGAESAQMHREAGREIGSLQVDVLWGVRGLATEIIEGAREAGMKDEATRFFESSEVAASALAEEVRAGDIILVKGSRGVRTDKIVSVMRERFVVSK